jgi:hypothetical protein
MAQSIAGIDDPFFGRQRPDSGHRLWDPLQAVGRVGAAYPRRGRGIHLSCSCQGAGSCCAPVCLPRRHGGGARCPCLQVGGLVDVSGADRRARGLRGELYAGVGVALNCCARAYVLALLAIPDLMA